MCSGLNKAAVDLEAEAKAACPVGTGMCEYNPSAFFFLAQLFSYFMCLLGLLHLFLFKYVRVVPKVSSSVLPNVFCVAIHGAPKDETKSISVLSLYLPSLYLLFFLCAFGVRIAVHVLKLFFFPKMSNWSELRSWPLPWRPRSKRTKLFSTSSHRTKVERQSALLIYHSLGPGYKPFMHSMGH